ncbi:YceI family protein [Tenacibaculum sp. 190524A02b]|uniref:YceI family protein n=1 Tax=Tenacibaculum vairaonense TaxID=3137860 RepID=A0ABM9PHJ8_9FLAO
MNTKSFNIKSIFFSVFVLVITTATAQSTTWKVDKSHSALSFAVDHMVISETTGQFNDYEITAIASKKDFTDAVFNVTIQTASIDTKDAKRDGHLKSPDFFDVKKYPTITFKSKKFKKLSGKKYVLEGEFMMQGVTKKVAFDVKFGGVVKDPWGNTRMGMKLIGEVNRYDYNLKYNSALEAGGLMIGKTVTIECRVELVKQ